MHLANSRCLKGLRRHGPLASSPGVFPRAGVSRALPNILAPYYATSASLVLCMTRSSYAGASLHRNTLRHILYP
ncbi:hypothetical protein GQ53DRAFT_463184 [Thozetella sp. PMI_491]|nr:hypothetical protein GQ53DRAFT_463184 [Thozetella sp. PMI_491]